MQFAKDDTGLHIYNISEVVLDAVCIMQYREPFSLSCHCLPRGDLDSWMTSASKISLMIQTFQGVRETFSLYVEFLKSCMVRVTLMYCRQDSCSFVRRGPCVYVCMYATLGRTAPKSRCWRGRLCAASPLSLGSRVAVSVSGSRLLRKLCWLTVSSLGADVPLPSFPEDITIFYVKCRKKYSAQQLIIFLLL